MFVSTDSADFVASLFFTGTTNASFLSFSVIPILVTGILSCSGAITSPSLFFPNFNLTILISSAGNGLTSGTKFISDVTWLFSDSDGGGSSWRASCDKDGGSIITGKKSASDGGLPADSFFANFFASTTG